MSTTKTLSFHADTRRDQARSSQNPLMLQIISAVFGVSVLIAGLWWLQRSEVSDVQFVLGMLAATGIALISCFSGFIVAARRNRD